MLPHAQRDLHQSLPQRDQALDECFNLVPDECMAIENHRENRSFQIDSLHVHAIIKASLFSFFFSFLIITKILTCIFWFLGFFAYCFIHPTLKLREKQPICAVSCHENYDSFMWTVDTPPSMLQG